MTAATLLALHVLASALWVGGICLAVIVLLPARDDEAEEDGGLARSFRRRVVGRLRGLSLGASAVVLVTGLALLPGRGMPATGGFVALSVVILGWCVLTAGAIGTMPNRSFSGREEDIEAKQEEEWDARRILGRHLVLGVVGIASFVGGVLLAHA